MFKNCIDIFCTHFLELNLLFTNVVDALYVGASSKSSLSGIKPPDKQKGVMVISATINRTIPMITCHFARKIKIKKSCMKPQGRNSSHASLHCDLRTAIEPNVGYTFLRSRYDRPIYSLNQPKTHVHHLRLFKWLNAIKLPYLNETSPKVKEWQ